MKILMTIDGTKNSQEMVCEALQQAWPRGTQFDVLHVREPVHLWTQQETEDRLLERAHECLNEAVFAIAESGFEGHRYLQEGSAKRLILDFAEQSQPHLILVGSRRSSEVSRFLLGSVSTAVLRHAKCSVQIIRPRVHDFRAESTYRVLLATDGSPQSLLAAEAIAARPWKPGTELRIISVVELILPPTLTLLDPTDPGFPPNKVEFEQAKKMAARAIHRAGKLLAAQFPHYTEAMPVISEGAKRAILREAEQWDANCIFLGSHGLSGVDRFLLGSVSEAVATHAHCCVEVVR